MNGVNVNIKISFEVKIVKIAIIALNEKNNFVWLLLFFDKITAAIYEKNPILSNKTEILVHDMNITNIFNGFIFASFKKMLTNGFSPAKLQHKQIIAPTKQKTQ